MTFMHLSKWVLPQPTGHSQDYDRDPSGYTGDSDNPPAIPTALREESSQTNVILQYKLLASMLSAVCSVIQQS